MKKILLILIALFLAITSNAQIYSKIIKCDKFDDVIYAKNVKTLISETDECVIFETKGGKELSYPKYSIQPNIGSKDSVVNIVKNLYGYENIFTSFYHEENGKISPCTIVHRTIISPKDMAYVDDLWWIMLNDGSRIIFSNTKNVESYLSITVNVINVIVF